MEISELLCSGPVSAPRGRLILAHGAGAPMDSPFMDDMAARLGELGVRVVRFEFPYMARRRLDGGRRPPSPQAQLLDCWRQIWREVNAREPGAWAVGGKSMGGRMASLLADELGAAALVCLGYPFHPAGRPDRLRVEHLAALRTPTLIVQGERDALGNRAEVTGYRLSAAIRLLWLEAADHDLKPLKASGCSQAAHLQRAAEAVAGLLG